MITALLLPELKVASFNCSRLSTCLNFFLRSHALLSISSSSIDNFLIKMRFITYCLFSFECLFLRFQLQLTQRVCCFYHNLVVPQYSSLRSYSIHFKAFLTFFTLKTYSLLDWIDRLAHFTHFCQFRDLFYSSVFLRFLSILLLNDHDHHSCQYLC